VVDETEAYPTLISESLLVDILNYDLRAAHYIKLDIPPGRVRQLDCINVLQYVPGWRRVPIWNEWQRLLVPGGRAQVVVPYYSHMQAFAHPQTEWPPMSEFSFMFLDKVWRNASPARAVEDLECDLVIESMATEMDAMYATRTQEWKDEALRWFLNCAVQMTVWLVKR
jgi:hypothetical protein